MADYNIYIIPNRSGTLYVGVTNDLQRHMSEHKQGTGKGFASAYRLTRLGYYEQTSDITAGIAREKQIKGWVRRKEFDLIQEMNPKWEDLSEG